MSLMPAHSMIARTAPPAITPAPGATPAPGRELTFLEQIIGNVGRFNKGGTTGGADTTTQTGRPYEPGDPNKR